MPAPSRDKPTSQLSLIAAADTMRHGPGRTETAVDQVVVQAMADGHLEALDLAMAALAVECGRGVDVAGRMRDPFALAAAARELRETLIRLRLDPTCRGAIGKSDAEAFMDALSEPD